MKWCGMKLPDMPVRKWIAWAVLVICIIGWPVSALTVASDEPQFVLGLSWVALILTAVLIVIEV